MRNGADRPIELYDLGADVAEANDVAARHPEVVARVAHIMASAAAPDANYPIAPPKTPGLQRTGN